MTMKKKLSFQELAAVGSMLFGLFFGAGNLIFPAAMGQLSGRNVFLATLGLLITGVGLPLLGVAALGISRCNGLAQLSERVGKKYSMFFTCVLYLTIGPFFAIPRCATVPFEVGISPLLSKASPGPVPLALFSLVFFGVVLWFSLKPGKILTWIGKILNPIFLVCLGILLITALVSPMGSVGDIAPQSTYVHSAFFSGFLEGYNTMDALAGLAFGIIVVNVIKDLGVQSPEAIASNTVKAGIFGCGLMGIIYLAVAVVGTQSRGLYPVAANGGEALLTIAKHYFGNAGAAILAVTVTFACLKTAVGLITSCSETFHSLFPSRFSYRTWAVGFCLLSFGIANLGLNAIIACALPVLMFLYPLAIALIFLALTGKWFQNDRVVYRSVILCTLLAAILDFIHALPASVTGFLHLTALLDLANRFLPFFSQGMGWVCPALIGLAVGLLLHAKRARNL